MSLISAPASTSSRALVFAIRSIRSLICSIGSAAVAINTPESRSGFTSKSIAVRRRQAPLAGPRVPRDPAGADDPDNAHATGRTGTGHPGSEAAVDDAGGDGSVPV